MKITWQAHKADRAKQDQIETDQSKTDNPKRLTTTTETTAERRAISLHIGMAHLSRYTYGQPAIIGSCERDAATMQRIADTAGFKPAILALNSHFNRKDLFEFFERDVSELEDGDSLLITFSGHGMTGKTPSGGKYEAWCLYDQPLYDHELLGLIDDLERRVEVLIISDSCDAGGMADPGRVAELIEQEPDGTAIDAETAVAQQLGPVKRLTGALIPPGPPPLVNVNGGPIKFFDLIVKDRKRTAHAVYIAACGVNQDTFAGATHRDLSTFTKKLVEVWNYGAFEGSFEEFERQLTPTAEGSIPEVEELDPIDDYFSKRGPFRLREI